MGLLVGLRGAEMRHRNPSLSVMTKVAANKIKEGRTLIIEGGKARSVDQLKLRVNRGLRMLEAAEEDLADVVELLKEEGL